MPLSWNEIKTRAFTFTNEWKDEVSEDAEAKSFWDDFFNVFGISRRRVATFEQKVSLTPTLSTGGEGAAARYVAVFIVVRYQIFVVYYCAEAPLEDSDGTEKKSIAFESF